MVIYFFFFLVDVVIFHFFFFVFCFFFFCFFFSSRRRHTRFDCDWSSDVCSSDLEAQDVGDGALPLGDREPLHPRVDGCTVEIDRARIRRRSAARSRVAPFRPLALTSATPRAPLGAIGATSPARVSLVSRVRLRRATAAERSGGNRRYQEITGSTSADPHHDSSSDDFGPDPSTRSEKRHRPRWKNPLAIELPLDPPAPAGAGYGRSSVSVAFWRGVLRRRRGTARIATVSIRIRSPGRRSRSRRLLPVRFRRPPSPCFRPS